MEAAGRRFESCYSDQFYKGEKMSKFSRMWFEGKPCNEDAAGTVFIETGCLFHIGQCYDEEPAKMIKCAYCSGTEFNVGIGSYFTAIRCIKCEWEICIHDG